MAIAANVFSGLLAFVFASAALAKLLRQKPLTKLLRQTLQIQTAEKLGIPWDRYRLIGVPEATAAIGLLIGYASAPIGAAAGIGLAMLMAGALFFRLRVHDWVGYLLADATLLGLATTTAVLRIN
jgi:DoxX-like protein